MHMLQSPMINSADMKIYCLESHQILKICNYNGGAKRSCELSLKPFAKAITIKVILISLLIVPHCLPPF